MGIQQLLDGYNDAETKLRLALGVEGWGYHLIYDMTDNWWADIDDEIGWWVQEEKPDEEGSDSMEACGAIYGTSKKEVEGLTVFVLNINGVKDMYIFSNSKKVEVE